MSQKLLQHLRDWRDTEAKRRGLEEYRILQNRSLEEIAETKPTDKEALLDIYGVAKKKYDRYGSKILDMVTAFENDTLNNQRDDAGQLDIDEPVSVSTFLKHVNRSLGSIEASVQGEITQIKEKYGNYYLTLSDSEEESAMDCVIKERHYEMAGFELEEGIEVVLSGAPSVYKKYGRFSFRARSVELVGEGALKKAYEKLKAKLTEEGIFAEEHKQTMPQFAQRIGLITSPGSDAYHDFAANCGQYGFSVQFYPSRVQGGRAVEELLEALTFFQESNVDAVVITRGGGGDLEVLQAFNNEQVVRAVSAMDTPVISGIGHEKDVPLTSLAADVKVSTPTGAAEVINRSWQQLRNHLQRFAQTIPARYQEVLRIRQHRLRQYSQRIRQEFRQLTGMLDRLRERMQTFFNSLVHGFKRDKSQLQRLRSDMLTAFDRTLAAKKRALKNLEQRLTDADPRTKLSQGYSIISTDEGVVRSIRDVSTGDDIEIRVADGTIASHVTDTYTNDDEE